MIDRAETLRLNFVHRELLFFIVSPPLEFGSSSVNALAVSLAARAKPKHPGVASPPRPQDARCANAPLGHAIVLPLLAALFL